MRPAHHPKLIRRTPPGISTGDAPIRSKSEDRLERAPFAERITERIHASRTGPSVVFGLVGPWGGGKSSVLEMIKEILADERHRKEWTVVTFTPWSATDTAALTDEFYRAIADAMPRDDAGNTARRLLAAAAPTASAVSKAAITALIEKHLGEGSLKGIAKAGTDALADQTAKYTFDPQPDPFAERFTKISNAIRKTGKNILVIVDDIDRLHSDELLSVMKAVRLLGRFDGVHYLLSYDEQTLLGVLEQTDLAGNSRPRARDYLEKIVQYPFTLPPLQESHLADELRTHIGQVAQNHDLSTAPQNGGSMDAANYVFRTIPHRDQLTLRTLYRLFGQVDVLITLVGKSDINLIDATLVTALRLRHPELYRSLPKWRRDLLGGTSNAKYKITAKDWQKRITDTTGLTSEDEIQATYKGLVTLFPRMEHPVGMIAPGRREACRVSDSNYFHRYFAFRIPTDDVSDETVRVEFKHLLTDGTWPSESIVLECITDASRNDLVRTKIGMNVDLVADATSAQCASAATAITTHLDPEGEGLGFNYWGMVLYPILLRAICIAATPTDAEQIITDYRSTCGLIAITRVLASAPYVISANDLATLKQATTNLRNEVCDVVIHDLTTDRAPDQRTGTTPLTFVGYLDEEMWEQMRQIIDPMIRSGGITQGDLAARFVSTYSEQEIRSFHREEFEKLVPRESWRADQFPEDDGTLPLEDTTLVSLAMYAARVVRPILEAE
ncbi:hypothetical protein GS441_17770 [Rhodococcus hoagii]|uniref:KAP NTPase domain-containing protein n=1 Tax=Rhodococcus hoagii TaxID=43767 RepID=A0A9Q2S8F3_RHOHA|nr:hypothetical protein [Prescottella equi]